MTTSLSLFLQEYIYVNIYSCMCFFFESLYCVLMHVFDIYISLAYDIYLKWSWIRFFSIPITDLCRNMFSFCLRKSVYILYIICPVTLYSNLHLADLASLHRGGGGPIGSWNTLFKNNFLYFVFIHFLS